VTRVGIDVAPLVQTAAGTARHVRGLLGALEGRRGLELERLTFGGGGRIATVARDAWWYPVGLGRLARDLDLLHCTTFRAPRRSRVPLVVTVHDLALLRHPEAFRAWHRRTGVQALRSAVRVADAIVAVSGFTRDELGALLDVPASKVRVVPNGVDPIFAPDGPSAPGSYVLGVSTLEPRKNLGAAVAAAEHAGVELRVVGAAGWGGVTVPGWLGRASDEELAGLYRGARCLVYPSLYEGFGIPVLEAMACGTPVVTSRGGATEEVAGGAAVLVDAADPGSIAAGIVEAETRREELVALGLERARGFTWHHAADLIEALWRELT
jgi:glycosyltransferase involved in cell wall biosynthesis